MNMDAKALVAVAYFRDLADAEIARMTLQSFGVDCMLCDQELVRIDWSLSTAIGGIKLLVRSEDAEAAKELLAHDAVGDRDGDVLPLELLPSQWCPKCGSPRIATFNAVRRAGLAAALLGFPVVLAVERLRCGECHHIWRSEDSASSGGLPGA
jgi:ribosomal protein S27AE